MTDMFNTMPLSGKNVYSYPTGTFHSIYITDYLENFDDHIGNIELIRSSSPQDTIRLIINSGGGRMDIMFSYIQALKEAQAVTIGHAEGHVCSAATGIWLHCKEISFAEHAQIMIHNYSGGVYGKAHELQAYIEAQTPASRLSLFQMYEGFLTKKEIHQVIDGKDLWFYKADDIKRRLENFAKFKQQVTETENKPQEQKRKSRKHKRKSKNDQIFDKK